MLVRANPLWLSLLAACTGAERLSPMVSADNALTGTVLAGPTGDAGASTIDQAQLTAMMSLAQCSPGMWAAGVSASGFSCVSALSGVASGNGVNAAGGPTPQVSLSGSYSGNLLIDKAAGPIPGAPLVLTQSVASDMPGQEYTRLTLRESPATSDALWTIAARTNNPNKPLTPEPNPNQGSVNFYYDPPTGAGGDQLVLQGNGNLLLNTLEATSFGAYAPTGFSCVATTNSAGTVAMRVLNANTTGLALQTAGKVDLMNAQAPETTIAPATLWGTPQVGNGSGNLAKANAVRLPLYRVVNNSSTPSASRAASCLPLDVVIGGSCTSGDGSRVLQSEPKPLWGEFICVFATSSISHVATAVCLKTY